MNLVGVHPAPIEHIPLLWEAMSGADRTEITLAAGSADPVEAIQSSVQLSSYSFAYFLGEQPAAVGGVRLPLEWQPLDAAWVWMVASTPLLACHRLSFLKASRAEVAAIRGLVTAKRLLAIEDARWRKSIRWLEWLGFKTFQTSKLSRRTIVCMEYQHA